VTRNNLMFTCLLYLAVSGAFQQRAAADSVEDQAIWDALGTRPIQVPTAPSFRVGERKPVGRLSCSHTQEFGGPERFICLLNSISPGAINPGASDAVIWDSLVTQAIAIPTTPNFKIGEKKSVGRLLCTHLHAIGQAETFDCSLKESQPVSTASAAQQDFDFSEGQAHGFLPIFRDVDEVPYREYERRLKSGESLGPVAPLSAPLVEIFEDGTHWLMNAGMFPMPDGIPGSGFLIQGTNRSDDMDMYLVRKFGKNDGMRPNESYVIRVAVDLAGDAAAGASGAGGGPTLKLGARLVLGDPTQYEIEGRHVRHPKEVKAAFGDFSASASIGTNGVCFAANSFMRPVPGLETCPKVGRIPFQLKRAQGPSSPMKITTDDRGEFWLMIGGHSGFESFSAIYYQRIRVWLASE
jgi:hypothetical protein